MKPNGWIQRCVALILRSRWPTLFVSVVVTGAAGYFASQLELDTSLETWFLEDNATLVEYKEFRKKFGEDEFVVLGIEVTGNDAATSVFTPEVLRELDRLTKSAEEIPNVRRVTSLTNVNVMQRHGRGSVRPGPLCEELPRTAEEADEFRARAATFPMVAGSLFSEDGRSAAIVVALARACKSFEEKAEVVHQLAARSEDPLPGVTIRLAGTPVISDAISRYLQKDLRILTPAAFAVVALSTFLLFRQFSVPLISSAVVAMASLCVVGVMGAADIQMNLLGPVLIMIILVVGVADSIHVFAAYFQELEHVAAPRDALDRALAHVLLPCLVTSLTTVAGFLSLLLSNLEPIRYFGVLAALGTALAFLISMFFIPACIQLFHVRARKLRGDSSATTMNRLLALLGRPTPHVARLVLILAIVIIVPSTFAPRFLEATANPMNYFHPEDSVRRDAERVDAALGGSASLEFIVRAPNKGFKNRAVLQRLDGFEVWLKDHPAVSRVTSFGGLLKEYNRVRRGRKKGTLPSDVFRVANLMVPDEPSEDMPDSQRQLLEAQREFAGSLVQDDFSLGRISSRIQAADSDKLASQAPEIEKWIREKVNQPGLDVRATGFVKLMDDMRSYLVESQVVSVIAAFVTITVMLCILFRSWKLALFSMIPNVGPILMGVALMAVLRIRLDPATVMIATIALGLVVDDTCHFLVRLRACLEKGMILPDAIAESMKQTGRPIILTSIILSAGFGVLMLGSFTPTLCFGLVSAFVLLAALVADLVVLPAALLVLRPKL